MQAETTETAREAPGAVAVVSAFAADSDFVLRISRFPRGGSDQTIRSPQRSELNGVAAAAHPARARSFA
jgi:hypothetical protein